MHINIASDFSRVPAGRYRTDGKYSAVDFRSDLLVPRLLDAEAHDTYVVVKLDGVMGYSSSFLEEAFGGLIREPRMTPDIVKKRLRIVADSSAYEAARLDALQYIDAAIKAKALRH